MIEKLLVAGEQDDLLAWIVQTFDVYPDQQLLQVFHGISISSDFQCAHGNHPVQTETAEAVYTYYPMHTTANA